MTEAQDNVKKALQEFAGICEGENSPTDVVIVCRRPDGSVGCFAPEGDTMPQIGLLHVGIMLMGNRLVGQ